LTGCGNARFFCLGQVFDGTNYVKSAVVLIAKAKIDPIGHDQKPERLLQNNHLIGATLG
jgi:hypothetical protein